MQIFFVYSKTYLKIYQNFLSDTMNTKTKSPLWIIVIGCAFYIIKCLIFNQYLIDIPAYVLILIFDLMILLSAMVPKATDDECKRYWEWIGRRNGSIRFVLGALLAVSSKNVVNVQKLKAKCVSKFQISPQ